MDDLPFTEEELDAIWPEGALETIRIEKDRPK